MVGDQSNVNMASLVSFPGSKSLLLIIFTIINVSAATAEDCMVGGYNLTPLRNWGIWHIKTQISDSDFHFYINPCGSVRNAVADTVCGDSTSSVCMHNVSSDSYTIIGNLSETANTFEHKGGFRMDFQGAVCPFSKVGQQFYNTSINFKCGNSLGSPVLLESSECSFFIEWHSTVACKHVAHQALGETRCYVYDNKNRKRDFTPLVKQLSGYLTVASGDYDFYINVCRNIEPDGPTASCPQEAAACRITNVTKSDGKVESQGFNMGGVPFSREFQSLDDDHHTLYYENNAKDIPGCNGHSPSTTISFVCPREGARLGGSRAPVVTSDYNCQFHVEWQTEYGCETEMLTSDTCKLDNEQYGVDIDLTPLKKTPGTSDPNYRVSAAEYTYFLNICDEACGGENTAGICQQIGDNHMVNAGKFRQAQLRYTDGELSLTYKGGNPCSSGFERTSVITFKCNNTAGNGNPTFVTEASCTYFFEWQTQYACHDHPLDQTCQVTVGRTQYDLGALEREGRKNWVALSLDGDESQDGTFLLNVCGNIIRDDSKNVGSTKCDETSSACLLEKGSKVANIGVYKNSPVFEDNHIKLKYVDGSACDNDKQKKSTVITFSCSPGDLERPPVFIRKSVDECLYEFEWRTAAACPLAKVKGHDCIVYDDEGGFVFDLSPLKGKDYKVNVTDPKHNYNYYIRVCGALSSSDHCIGTNVGACQEKNVGSGSYITGQANSDLNYYDGILKLTYLNGDEYNTPDGPVPRRTEIAFLCDPDAVDTEPMYMSEGNFTYFFKWYTNYACPAEPVQCSVTQGNQQYDLSSLSASKALDDDNWSVIDDTVPGHRYKLYLHVCKPLNPVAGCGALSSSCMVEIKDGNEKAAKSNLGISRSPPIVESVGHVMLTYANGISCGSRASETRIHFICVKGSLATSPRLLEKIDGCDYIFEWETEAACPIDTSTSSSDQECTVKDTNSGYTFNLNPLKLNKGYYNVNGDNGDTFKINICGSVTGDQCNGATDSGACHKHGEISKSLGRASSKLEYSDDGHLSLSYKGDYDVHGELTEVEITFLCRHEVSGNHHGPTFLRNDGSKWLFNFETPYACLPQAVDCLIADSHGNEYDLTPLAKEDGNWEVVDTRENKRHLRYHINICRPLNNNADYNCPGGAIGSCQTSTTGNAADKLNLGYIQSMPEAAPDGSVSIQYENGDICNGNVRYSTRIIFECSDRPGSPVLQVVSNECEFVFSWQTPAACPLQSNTGNNCVVDDPELGFQFNLTSLYNSSKDYEVVGGAYQFVINPCGNLVSGKGSCNKRGVGACQLKSSDPNFSKVTGMTNSTLVYEGGRLKLNYTGGEPCHDKVYERSTSFVFYCDKTATVPGEPKFIDETTDCTYIFEWATPLACPPFDLVQCSYRSSTGTQFDLSPLTRIHDNYKITPSYHSKNKPDIFYMNVCRPIVHSHNVEGSKCPGNSAACLQTGTPENTRYIDLGHIKDPPSWINNHLTLTYEGGDPCMPFENSEGNLLKKTTIAFICDKDSEATGPSYAYGGSYCFYHFNWFTELACELEEEDDSNDCTVTNPATGYRFDLSSLKKANGYTVSGSDGHIYTLNICGALSGSKCTDDSKSLGVCQVQSTGDNPQSFDAGHFNQHLSFDSGILMLNYEDGKPCHQAQFTRSSIINFVCPHEDGVIGQPVFVDESQDCTYYFSWHTSLACETQISCKATNGVDTIDLSHLVNDQGYYLATNLDSSETSSAIYLNPCRPLNPIPRTRCPPSAAGCVAKYGEKPFSIGKLSSTPVLLENGNVNLTYTDGDPCSTDKSRKLTTVIIFSCDPGTSHGTPKLTSIDNCAYHFLWMTSSVCPPSKPEKTTECKYNATNLDYVFDLTPLSTEVKEITNGDSKKYSINICKSVFGDCDDAAVCLTSSGKKISLGNVASQEFSYTGHNLKVTYSNGAVCPVGDGKRHSEIIFECNESEGLGKPQLVTSDDQACYYSFIWRSDKVCPPMHRPCDIVVDGKLYDLHALSRSTSSWEVTDKGKKYYMNICTTIMNGPSGCDQAASVCSEDTGTSTVESLGMEYTQQLTSGSHKPDLKIVFTEGNSNACNNQPTATEITFKCGNAIGTPNFKGFVSSSSTCKYTFEWITRFACPEETRTVEEKNGKITNPETKQVIDISELKSKQYTVKETRQDTTYIYYISLDGDVSEKSGCTGSAVCQTNPSGNFVRNIGMSTYKKFYITDDTLEMVVTNPDSCLKGGDVNSTIIFQCDQSVGLGEPEFQYESIKCHYVFTWRTDKVCTKFSTGTRSLTSRVGGSHKISIIIAVFTVLIVICCLALYFHEHERRWAFVSSVKRCFNGGYSNIPSYKYTKLSAEEEEEDDRSLLEDMTPRELERQHPRDSFFKDDDDDELLGDLHPSQIDYHDESDEELLPTV
ncbi:cation-independent mannose-6-phosphate receptor-like [Anneissia japonica]|uniref:cation-independent mannose-6-phosphate receptor-like n=1 Tax=Anneissia japonica TaxID=1529436 RepID=UPI0014258EA3|nr:cation-independent mannose-6-phosphate receptor-like [Anneissia japonica]